MLHDRRNLCVIIYIYDPVPKGNLRYYLFEVFFEIDKYKFIVYWHGSKKNHILEYIYGIQIPR